MASTEVHMLDRFLPELQSYLIIDDIGPYLIADGLLSPEDYLMLTERSPKKRAVVEMMQLVKRKGPDSLQRFLNGLDRSCASNSTHGGHIHLQKLFQDNISTSSTHQHLIKKQKSRPMSSLLPWNKHSKSNKDGKSSSHKSNKHHSCKPSSNSTSPPATYSMTQNDSSPSDEDNLSPYPTSSQSQDSYNNPEPLMLAPIPPAVLPPHAPITDHSAIIEELQKENKKLKKALKKEEEKYNAVVKVQSLKIEDLKADKDKYTRKIQSLEAEISALQAKDDSLVKLQREMASLPLKIQRLIMQEKEPLEKSIQGSSSRARRTRSLNNGAMRLRSLPTNSTSLTCINEVEGLKSKLMKKEKVFNSKLDELVEMCREPSGLNRRCYSEAKLPIDRHHREDNYYSLYSHSNSQT